MKIYSKDRTHPVYVIVYDSDDEDKVYGMMKFDLSDIDDEVEVGVNFYNEDGKIDLRIREVSKSEYETYEAFKLFPILTPYARQELPSNPNSGS